MKKRNSKSDIKGKFRKDPQKRYIKKFRFYPSFLYCRLDKWLKKMSATGWHVVHCGIFFFWFEEGEPGIKEYFTYGLSTQEGKYDINLRHPFLEKTYGVEPKKSKINANRSKTLQIVEIDTAKIDVNNNVGYKELISDRNSLYLKYFIKWFSFALILMVILAITALVF